MNVFKITRDKSLVTTVHKTIYQGEDNAHSLCFILPKEFSGQAASDYSVLLRMILPNGTGYVKEITASKQVYNDNYLSYSLRLGSPLTRYAGDAKVWLSIISTDGEVVAKTGAAVISIYPASEIADWLPEEDRDGLDSIEAKIARLETEKADNIAYNDKTGNITLTSQGLAIGDELEVSLLGDDGFVDFDLALDAAIHNNDFNVQKTVNNNGS